MSAIDKKAGYEALGKLVKSGAISGSDVDKYRRTVDNGLSYADVIVMDLGADVGMRYLREEFVQHFHFTGQRLPFDKLSVPEVLLIENSEKEPWHKGAYSTLSWPKRLQQEAAEPWHPSLRKTFAPDADVSLWFNNHPKYINEAVKILATVDGKKPPSEDDIAKLAAGR
jgi:hypothetical protein